ncbi:MAG: DUF1761 domain-containing protein [Patescibacteria group bacterium]
MINYVAVVVAAVVAFVIGWVWYGPIFGKRWMHLHGKSYESMSEMKMPMGNMAIEFIATLVTAYVLARFVVLLGVVDVMGAIHLTVWVWLGFIAAIMVGGVLWENEKWELFWIKVGGRFLTILAMTVILGVWH